MSLESDFEKMCQFATQVTMELLGANLSALALPAADAEHGLRFRFFSGFPPEIDTAALPGITPGTAAAFKSGKCVYVADYANYAGALPGFLKAGVCTGFAAPIRLGGVVTGVLTLAWTRPAQEPGEQQTELVEAVLRQVGFAYQRDQLLRDLSLSRADAVEVRQHLERVLAVSPVVIYSATVDPQEVQGTLRLTYISDNIGHLIGHEKAYFADDPARWQDLMHPEDRTQTLLRNHPEAFAQGALDRIYRVRHDAGHYLWIHDSMRLLSQSEGGRFDLVGAIVDITERKLAESELRRHRDHLQDLVREQTADLIAAKDAAERALREAKQAEEHIRFLALNDALTGLPNRVLLLERLDQAMRLSQRSGKKLALMFIDLDRFKNINDSLGHSVGDELLCEVSRRFVSCVRQSDTVSRQGGDEFVILLEQIESTEAVASIANQLLSVVAEPYVVDDYELSVTHSIGIIVYPDDATEVDDIMRKADAAMYRAKELGRNNYQFYAQDMSASALSRLSLENDLRRALDRQEFRLVYQPQISLATGRVVGLEALIRWHHPERGVLHPKQFIALAEENGQIVSIGLWVLRTACAQAQAWRAQGLMSGTMAVNLSAVQLRRKGFPDEVLNALRDTGLPGHALMLELTESTLMHDTDNTVSALRILREQGVKLAIDDFGTHYSSLSYLKRFPVDSLKIDGSFISDIHTDADAAAITRAIISMGHSLRLTVIAEGVETQEQCRFLEQLECDGVQGHYLGVPAYAGEMQAFLQLQRGAVTLLSQRRGMDSGDGLRE
ncbi:MAG TPA: EAL domain-containing protein [Burkholderiaceae bacterium]|nr:EAL domain-containing protein [Burkholderiaceae bacterium]